MRGQEFSFYGYNPQDTGDPAFGYDQQGTNLERSQEGFIEIIEMGILTGEDAENATHLRWSNNCSALVANWSPDTGKWLTNPNENLQAPDGSGGLSGSMQLVNVINGVDMNYVATAIQLYSTEIQHTSPASLTPNLASGNNSTTLIKTDKDVLQTTWNSPLDAVTALFMNTIIQNDFDINPTIGAQTDWVNTYPTKHFYVDSLYTDSAPLHPFMHELQANIGACDEFIFNAFDREQKHDAGASIVGVLPPAGVFFPRNCRSVNVSYADTVGNTGFPDNTNSLFNSMLIINSWVEINFNSTIDQLNSIEGTIKMDLITQENTFLSGVGNNGDTHTIYGKPTIGFVAQKYANGVLIDNDGNAVLANYGLIKQNKNTRRIDISTPAK